MAARIPSDALFLGFDSSTQSLKVTVVDSGLHIFLSDFVNFDSELPHYGTKGGVHRQDERVTAPVLMWIEALELVLDKLKLTGFPFEKVRAISGSGQQHGSVYWKKGACELLKNLNDSGNMLDQLQHAFSTNDSPVWMDSSTTVQCREIEKAVGGAATLATLTGSRAYERFTGPQIKKLYETQKDVYDDTERISLVSSFMASVLIGDYASIDCSDGAGMNLMNYKQRNWSDAALKATAPGLAEKLGKLAASHAVAGNIHPFYVKRYNFRPDCMIIQWSGDNPCSLSGLALSHPGDIAISLGTSDTLFGITADPKPGLEGHVFPNPVDPASYMVMLCYKNGSLTREAIRDEYADGSWQTFNKLLDQTPPLNNGRMGFYYKQPEILPPLPAGIHRFKLDLDGEKEAEDMGNVEFDDGTYEVRAVVEGQFVSMRAHAERIGIKIPPNRIIATGGASANYHLLQLISSIFGSPLYTAQTTDSASLGAALRAAHGWICSKEGNFVGFTEMFDTNALSLKLASHHQQLHVKYSLLARMRAEIEERLLSSV